MVPEVLLKLGGRLHTNIHSLTEYTHQRTRYFQELLQLELTETNTRGHWLQQHVKYQKLHF